MKRLFIAVTIAAATLSAPAFAQVSVSIGQPGFYGRLDIGGFPAPALIYPQPVMIEPVPIERPPLYLRVPPGHARDWGRHCHRYNACGERVFFVQDSWYNREYAPRYYERHRDYGREYYRDDDRREYRREYREDEHEHRHGRGRENEQ